MVTVLDVGLIQAFDIIFPVLLVFALVFAVLQKTKVIGDSVGINSIIAVAVAFMVMLSDTLVQMISFMVPWFVVVIIFFILVQKKQIWQVQLKIKLSIGQLSELLLLFFWLHLVMF